MKLRKVFRFRMRPTEAQQEQLRFQAGARRWVWNWALARKTQYYQEHGKGLPTSILKAELPILKAQPETAWLKSADSQALQETLRDLDRGYANFFARRGGFPKFKSKKKDSARFRVSQRVSVSDNSVRVPKIGKIRIRQSQEVDGETKSATFKRDPCGNWDVTLVGEFEMPDTTLPAVDGELVVGVDLGLKDFAVISTGERVESPKFFRKQQRKLRKAQRVFSRTKKGSKRRAKAKIKQARVHAQTAGRRSDFLHKITTNLVRNYDAVCIEDLSVKGLARTKLAKSIHDASLGQFRRQLEYKGLWNRKHVPVIDRFFPSSKTCHVCGAINGALTLSDREWTCPSCGSVLDRDLNASLNIRAEGLKLIPVAVGHPETLNARGADVRPSIEGCPC